MYQCKNCKLYKYSYQSLRLIFLFSLFCLFSIQTTIVTHARTVSENISRQNQALHSIHQQENSCITGYVWLDGNRNGVKDPIENGVAKVLVKIYDFAGRQSGTDITDGSGYFIFSDLPYGEYHVEFIQPVGFDFPVENEEEEDEGWTLVTTMDCETGDDYLETPLITTANSGPTAIDLDTFDAEQAAGPVPAIEIKWVTQAEIDTNGFYLYRSVTGYREDAVRVTPAIVPAQSDGEQRAKTYTFNDQTVFPEVELVYTYWLTEEETTGELIDYGPIHAKLMSASLGAASVPNKVYLPFIQK